MRVMILSAAGLLLGCGKKIVEDRYYSLVLEAAADREATDRVHAEAHVSLAEVVLPDFLMLQNLSLQTSSNEIIFAKHHHWADPLDESVQKVLIWDLSARLPTLEIDQALHSDADCTLRVEFDRLHANSSDRVLVSGRYSLTSEGTTQHREFDVSQRLVDPGYTAAVSRMRDALAALSVELQPMVEACVTRATRARAPLLEPGAEEEAPSREH